MVQQCVREPDQYEHQRHELSEQYQDESLHQTRSVSLCNQVGRGMGGGGVDSSSLFTLVANFSLAISRCAAKSECWNKAPQKIILNKFF